MRLLRLLVLATLPAGVLTAQDCPITEDDNEAKLLAFFAAPIAFSPGGNVTSLGPGKFRLGFEVTYVPEPSASIQRATKCYNDKAEDTQLSPVFPRPRVALGLGAGWFVEASYLPPIPVVDATPNLGSVAIARLTNIGPTGLLLRAHATFGKVEGPITCPEDALQTTTTTRPCYGTEESEDTYKPNMFGGEAALVFSMGELVSAYGGTGYTSLRPRFRVGWQDGRPGAPYDSTRLEIDLNRITLFGGALFKVAPFISFMAELYSVPEDVTTFRVGASYAWR